MAANNLLIPANCCLHIVDPQEKLMKQIHEADRVTATAKLMLESARIMGIPVIANTQYKRGLGPYVPELEKMMADIARPDKIEFNALANKETRELVEGISPELTTLILVGVETHICIYQTAMGALQMGLVPWIVADGVSSRKLADHEMALARLVSAGAVVGPSEMIIYELLAKAGTKEFKEILPLIV